VNEDDAKPLRIHVRVSCLSTVDVRTWLAVRVQGNNPLLQVLDTKDMDTDAAAQTALFITSPIRRARIALRRRAQATHRVL
jgi:hypothetical protein